MSDPAAIPTTIHVSLLGAAGQMGGLFARELNRTGHRVSGFDLHTPNDAADFQDYLVADALAPSPAVLETWLASDVVIVCLPDKPALAALRALVPGAREDALVVDTMSVKTPLSVLLGSLSYRCEYLSINPMFAPSLGFAGQKVLAVEERPGPRSKAFIAMLEKWGAAVMVQSAREHDRACAVMQTATHMMLLCLGRTVTGSGLDVADLLKVAPPPHWMSLALLSRILTAAPETYWDIQRDNPYSQEVRQQLGTALSELGALVQSNDFAGFAAALESMRKTFEPHLPHLTKIAATAIRSATK